MGKHAYVACIAYSLAEVAAGEELISVESLAPTTVKLKGVFHPPNPRPRKAVPYFMHGMHSMFY